MSYQSFEFDATLGCYRAGDARIYVEKAKQYECKVSFVVSKDQKLTDNTIRCTMHAFGIFDQALTIKEIYALHMLSKHETGHATEKEAMNACIDAMKLTHKPGGKPSRRAVRWLSKRWDLPGPVVKDALSSEYGRWASLGGKVPHAIAAMREAWYSGAWS